MMIRLRFATLFVFSALLLLLLTSATAVHAQEGPVTIEGVQPDAGYPDTEMELRLFGSGFELMEEIEIFITGVEVFGFDIESDESVRVDIYIPADVPPGRKAVAISYVLDNTPFRVFLRDGFELLPPEERPAARMDLFAVEPAEGAPDTEMEIYLIGTGFESNGEVAVDIEGLEIFDQWIESDEVIGLNIYVPDDAWPGWRLVEVVNEDGREAILEEGFNVMETDQPLPPAIGPGQTGGRDEPGTSISWFWPLTVILLMVVSYAVGRGRALRSKLSWSDGAKLQWCHEAKTKLPEPRRACQWACKATAGANLLNRWQVKHIELRPLDVKGKTPRRKIVDNKHGALDPLNDLTNIAGIMRSPQAVREHIAVVVEAILAQILDWEREGQSPASIRLDAQLAGEIEAEFGLYHCHQTGSGLSWGKDPLLKWKGKLNQPAGEFLGVLRGPTVGEADFAGRARQEIEECLLDLLNGVQIWL